MLVAFVGTHVPILALLVYFLASTPLAEMEIWVLLTALVATIVGTALSLTGLAYLLAPIVATSKALRQYLSQKQLPNLPTKYKDEVGTLMADTSHTLRQLDEVINYATNYNDVTGLPNRVLLQNHLQQAVSRAERSNQLLAILSVSLDHFQDINNTLGYSSGDLLLRLVAERLSECVRQTDAVFHIGGEKFALLQNNLTTTEGAITLAQRVLSSLSEPFSLETREVHTSASVGITISPSDGVDVEQLLRRSNTAMNQAKQRGGDNHQFHSQELNAKLQERLTLENELRRALRQEEMLLYYQPLVALDSERIIGVEALLRWQHPQLGLVSPAKFIPIAEENGLIVPIGKWVLQTACAQNCAWQRAGLPPLRMAVNLSARQFKQVNLVEMVAQVLQEVKLDATNLGLEITESLLMENVQHNITLLQQLHNMGITLSLDDFGTGYSSLSYLKRFPIDTLKIDRSFVRDLVENSEDAAITSAIISLAQNLRLGVIAEGVETREQMEYLKANGCSRAQGYYYSAPVPADTLTLLLEKQAL